MDHLLIEKQITRVLMDFEMDLSASVPSGGEWIPSPFCVLDKETYLLLAENSVNPGYPVVFTQAIESMKDHLGGDQLQKVCWLVKTKRSRGRHKNVRTKLRRDDMEWLKAKAVELGTQPARILEAFAFIFLRIQRPNS